MIPAGTFYLLQAEVIGDTIGAGVLKLIGIVLLIVAVISGLILYLWLIRKIDKKINK